jgi:CheY-like chemotaxis protein
MKRVLVVDDEFGLLEAISDLLAESGYAVTVARNGRDALKRIGELKPDLVLADYMMPVMDGAAFIRALHALDGCGQIPVVMMTAVKAANVPRDLKLVALLEKPFGIDLLLEAIREQLG